MVQHMGAVHRLQEEIIKREVRKILRRKAGLGKDELELIAPALDEFGTRLGADANPVDPLGDRQRAVGFDSDLETMCVEPFDKGRSSSNSGSPPVGTTNSLPSQDAFADRTERIDLANREGSGKILPPCPSVPRKSVSQNRQMAAARPSSRPDDRLQPATRKKRPLAPLGRRRPVRYRKLL
jgi:hypothetical protein